MHRSGALYASRRHTHDHHPMMAPGNSLSESVGSTATSRHDTCSMSRQASERSFHDDHASDFPPGRRIPDLEQGHDYMQHANADEPFFNEHVEEETLLPGARHSLAESTDKKSWFPGMAQLSFQALSSLPAVFLAVMLNLLDAMSYGIIIFPPSDVHMPASSVQGGISMFLASTLISQLIFSGGGSAFKGAVGSMMIEVMPFLHIICTIVERDMSGQSRHAIIATVMIAYATSTILTGLVFLLLGIFKMGALFQFFPRHILIGSIGNLLTS